MSVPPYPEPQGSRPKAGSSHSGRRAMLIAAVVILVLLVFFIVAMYNGLVSLKVQCDNAWSDIDVQLKRRDREARNADRCRRNSRPAGLLHRGDVQRPRQPQSAMRQRVV